MYVFITVYIVKSLKFSVFYLFMCFIALSFQAFLDACFEISKICFPAETKLEMLENFVGHCESHLCLRENED